MTELLRLVRLNSIHSTDVDRSKWAPAQYANTLIHHHPTNALQAKFSMEFCMAIILVDGTADLTKFTDAVRDPDDVQAMINRVRFLC